MSKDIPYFRFTCQEWSTGDISMENDSMKGLFVDICAYFWSQNCSVFYPKLLRKFPKKTQKIQNMVKLGIIKVKNDNVDISFLSEQWAEIAKKSKKLSKAGIEGVRVREANKQARLKPPLSNKEKEKEKENIKQFENFRLHYPGTKRGLETEYQNFKKHKNHKEVLPQLLPSLKTQIATREAKKAKGEFVAEWKHLQTWINKRCWEEQMETQKKNPVPAFALEVIKNDYESYLYRCSENRKDNPEPWDDYLKRKEREYAQRHGELPEYSN